MVKAQIFNQQTFRTLERILLIVAPLVTLAVSPSPSYDPINLVKVLFLATLSFGSFGILISQGFKPVMRIDKIVVLPILLFFIFLILSLFFSGAPKNQQFWGDFGRSTGFLTYLSFLLFLFVSYNIVTNEFQNRVVNSLILTSVPITFYCLIQIAGLDPVSWSTKDTFATLGNINFLSAFLGMVAICLSIYLFNNSISFKLRIIWSIFLLADLAIVLSTSSIQGVLIFGAGITVAVFIAMYKTMKKIYWISFLFLTIIATYFTIQGLFNKGFLAKILFQNTIIFRTDYWHAGWVMTKTHPLTGVGLDSYGDWYRQVRGEISTLRTGPNRISNSAHNIFLDISSNGGFPLIIAYLCILSIAFYAGVKRIRNMNKIDFPIVALFSAWIGYQIQALVSINQVGVGVWGWLFTGALLATLHSHKNNEKDEGDSKKSRNRSRKIAKNNSLPPAAGLIGFCFGLVGFLLAFLPFKADADFKSALQSRDLNRMMAASQKVGASSFYSELTLQAAMNSNLPEPALKIAMYLNERYPRNFMGWGALQALTNSTPSQKDLAIKKLHELDPFNPDLPKS